MGDNFIERKNRLKQEFYKLFSVPEFVECSVIDMVLQQCNYDGLLFVIFLVNNYNFVLLFLILNVQNFVVVSCPIMID